MTLKYTLDLSTAYTAQHNASVEPKAATLLGLHLQPVSKMIGPMLARVVLSSQRYGCLSGELEVNPGWEKNSITIAGLPGALGPIDTTV